MMETERHSSCKNACVRQPGTREEDGRVREEFKCSLSEALLDRLCGGPGGLSGGGVDVAEFAPCSSDASF